MDAAVSRYNRGAADRSPTMHPLRRPLRLLRLLPHLALGLWQAATRLPAVPPPRTEREWATVRNWHRRALEHIGIDVRIHGTPATGPALFVANHVSWLDIGTLSTVVDAGFIGKQELARWPVLGFLIRRGGTIFIERGGRGAAASAAEEMTRRLARGERVAVFPEGTTSDGSEVRRFHPRLLEAAQRTGVPVQPVALVYDSPDAAFVDDEPFLRHLWRILARPRTGVDVWLLPPIVPAGHDRSTLAREARAAIAAAVDGPPTAGVETAGAG